MEQSSLSLLLVSIDETLFNHEGNHSWYTSIASKLSHLTIVVPTSTSYHPANYSNISVVPFSVGAFSFFKNWLRLNKWQKEYKVDGIVYEHASLEKVAKLIERKFHKKVLGIDIHTLPILYDFRSYWKTAHYKSIISSSDYFIQESGNDWGEQVVKALAAGMTTIIPNTHTLSTVLHANEQVLTYSTQYELEMRISWLKDHPEEAYRLAKNGQMWVKNELNQHYLPSRLISYWAQTFSS